jgi:hypothetical protein
MKVDPLNFVPEKNTEYGINDHKEPLIVHLNGIMYRVFHCLDPFYEWIGFGLSFISMLMWMALIFFFVVLALCLVVGIGTGIIEIITGVDLLKL